MASVWCIHCNNKIDASAIYREFEIECGHKGAVCLNCSNYALDNQCYACLRKVKFQPNAQPNNVCLMCNAPYAEPYVQTSNLSTITAACKCQGVGHNCAMGYGGGCKLYPTLNKCHACRHSPSSLTPKPTPQPSLTLVDFLAQLKSECAELRAAADALAAQLK
jgi:hypothetical protein